MTRERERQRCLTPSPTDVRPRPAVVVEDAIPACAGRSLFSIEEIANSGKRWAGGSRSKCFFQVPLEIPHRPLSARTSRRSRAPPPSSTRASLSLVRAGSYQRQRALRSRSGGLARGGREFHARRAW